MPAQPPAPEDLEEAVAGAVAGRPEVAAVYLYGSAAAGRTTPLSDVDVAVLFREETVDPRAGRGVLSEIVGELARRLPGVSFDVRDLESLPLSVQGRVLTEGSLLVDGDPSRRVAFEVRTRLLYFDFLPFQRADTREGLRALRERFGSG